MKNILYKMSLLNFINLLNEINKRYFASKHN